MSTHSIEHNLTFNVAKRVIKFIDPAMKVVATKDLSNNDSIMDLIANIIYVPEGQPMRAAGIILFYAGLLKLKESPKFKYSSVFGHINPALMESDLIKQISKEHADADELAFKWALKQFGLLFPEVDPARATALVDQRLFEDEWSEYFSEAQNESGE